MFDNRKIEYFFKKYFLIIFTCFLKIILKNNYINIKND